MEEVLIPKTVLIPSEVDTWRSGCAYGLDTIAARQAILSGVSNVELYVPHARYNNHLVTELANRAKVIVCQTSPEPYRTRNEWMLEGKGMGVAYKRADKLVAFLKSDNFYRSGEWMTVNIANRLGVPVEQIIFS
jgi:hypothetical protein